MSLGNKAFFMLVMTWLVSGCGKKEDNHTAHSGHNVNHQTEVFSEDVDRVVLSNQRTVKPQALGQNEEIIGQGTVVPDESRYKKYSARVSGRIDKLYVRYNYQFLKQGDPIFELYSPDLVTAQEEYLLLLKKGEKVLAENAREKLLLLGLSDKQLIQVKTSAKAIQSITVYTPNQGYIILAGTNEKPVDGKPASGADMSNMGMEPPKGKSAITTGLIKEGAYITKGQEIFQVNDLAQVWAIVSLSQVDVARIKVGSPATIRTENGTTVNSFVSFIEPSYESDQKFTRLRIMIPGDTAKLNTQVTVTITPIGKRDIVTVPLTSILDLGKNKLVWLKIDERDGVGVFKAKKVKTGSVIGNRVEIIEGLSPQDEVAENAGYMIDSESLQEIE